MTDWPPPALPEPIEFDTERLRLRQWRDSDYVPFAALNADPDVMEFFPALLDRQASDAMIEQWRRDFAERGWSNWAVEAKATGEYVGFVGLSVSRHAFPFPPCVEIGWRLARTAWGKGFASEAARAALRVGFESIGLTEIFSWTTIRNTRSRAVMERIGLVNLNRDFDHPRIPEGNPLRPHCLYRLDRARWRAGQA